MSFFFTIKLYYDRVLNIHLLPVFLTIFFKLFKTFKKIFQKRSVIEKWYSKEPLRLLKLSISSTFEPLITFLETLQNGLTQTIVHILISFNHVTPSVHKMVKQTSKNLHFLSWILLSNYTLLVFN